MLPVSNFHSVSFSQVAGKSCGKKKELKICEGHGCGRLFVRPAERHDAVFEALCPACQHRALKRPPARTVSDVRCIYR